VNDIFPSKTIFFRYYYAMNRYILSVSQVKFLVSKPIVPTGRHSPTCSCTLRSSLKMLLKRILAPFLRQKPTRFLAPAAGAAQKRSMSSGPAFPEDDLCKYAITLDQNYVEFLMNIGIRQQDAVQLLNSNWACNWFTLTPGLCAQHLVGRKKYTL